MTSFISTIQRYFKEKSKYWLILATFIPIILPHTVAAQVAESTLDFQSTIPIITSQIWPDYDQTFDTTPAIKTKTVVVTAYTSEVAQTDDSPFITAWGTHVRDGIIATNDLPRGTRVRFPELYGSKVFTVEDRMNKRYTGTGRVDIWMAEKPAAIKFGARRLAMEVLPKVTTLADNK